VFDLLGVAAFLNTFRTSPRFGTGISWPLRVFWVFFSVMPQCPFCQRKHRTRKGEHVLPKWMALEFPDSVWAIENRLTKYVRKSVKYIHITTNKPCPDCNSGWMSDLERLASPVLIPLMHGTPTTLDIREQMIIAVWFIKTAMTYDLHSEQFAPRPRYFEENDHRALRSWLAFNPIYQFYVGAYAGTQPGLIQEDHFGVSLAERNSLKPLSEPSRAYALTLVIKHLVLQVFCSKDIDTSLPVRMRPFRGFSIPITSSAPVNWPPPRAFGDKLIEKYIYRWSADLPPPT
jgi:hypothetical protein